MLFPHSTVIRVCFCSGGLTPSALFVFVLIQLRTFICGMTFAASVEAKGNATVVYSSICSERVAYFPADVIFSGNKVKRNVGLMEMLV